MIMKTSLALGFGLLIGSGLAPHATAASSSLNDALSTVLAVGPEGRGNDAASLAWPALANQGPAVLPQILSAMDGANALSANWIRAAVGQIVEKAARDKQALPVSELGLFLLDPSHSPEGRRLAYDLIAQASPETAAKLLPGMLNDPATALRRDAVALLIRDGEALVQSGDKQGGALVLRQALNFARDVDQIQGLNKSLKGLGQQVDLPSHFGFLMNWKVIGPFDNTGRSGFDTVFPPEKELNFNATYDGKAGKVTWKDFSTTDEYGMVDVNKAYDYLKEVTAYCVADYESPEERNVQLRLGCKNAWKVWLNGELLFGRDEYHRGMRIDQYTLPARLKAGHNTILVKVCQNEQTQSWTKEWEFQLRVCDETGTAILAANRPATGQSASR